MDILFLSGHLVPNTTKKGYHIVKGHYPVFLLHVYSQVVLLFLGAVGIWLN
jgi:hypothetical protein